MLLDCARRHSGIAGRLFVGTKTHLLPFARAVDAFTDRGGTFFRSIARDVAVFDRWHFDVQVDAIEQWTGNALPITLHLHRAATAFAFQIAEVATRAGVHRRHEHELGRKSDRAGRARDGDATIFERLAQHFERRAFELRQFIEKEDAVVRDAHFAGRGNGRAA